MVNTCSISSARLQHALQSSVPDTVATECQRILEDIERAGYLKLPAQSGPYNLTFSLLDNRLDISILDASEKFFVISVGLSSLRSLIRDYLTLCTSHEFAAIGATPYRLEAIDMGRRSLHNEGAEFFINVVQPEAIIDMETARRVFSLIVALSPKVKIL